MGFCLEPDLLPRSLAQIEDYIRDRYYPFILEDIEDFYDRVEAICVRYGFLFEF